MFNTISNSPHFTSTVIMPKNSDGSSIMDAFDYYQGTVGRSLTQQIKKLENNSHDDIVSLSLVDAELGLDKVVLNVHKKHGKEIHIGSSTAYLTTQRINSSGTLTTKIVDISSLYNAAKANLKPIEKSEHKCDLHG